MKIGMILSPSEQVLYSGVIPLPPHSLGVMTSYMRSRGHDVRQYDLNTDLEDQYLNGTLTKEEMKIVFHKDAVCSYLEGEENPEITRFVEKLLAGKPVETFDVVGISSGGTFYWMTIHGGFLIAKYIKKKYNIPVVIGGNNMIYLLSHKEKFRQLWDVVLDNLHFVIVGAGLESFRKLCHRFQHNPNWIPTAKERSDIKGLIYLENGKILHVPQDRDQVIKPDFKGLRLDYYMNFLKNPANAANPEEIERANVDQMYRWPPEIMKLANRVYRKRTRRKPGEFIKKLALPYIFQYHCPYNCAFCSESNEENQVVIGDPVKVVDDIEEMVNDYDTPFIQFYNNYFNLSRKFALTFCEEIKKRKLKFHWSDCARFNGVDYDFLVKLKESGCKALWFGMESASEKILKMIDKKIDLELMEKGLGLCKEIGIWANLEIIVGFPHETKKDFWDSASFIKRNSDKINFFQDNRFYVIPYSLIGRHPERYNIELQRDLITYEKLMQGNIKWFMSGKGLESRPNSFYMHPFNEIGGKNHEEVFKEGLKRQRYMNSLKKKEFHQITQMLMFMDSMEKERTLPAAS